MSAHFELLGWKREAWDFTGKRRYAFAVSAMLVLLGLAAVVQMARGRARLGIDFAGGVVVQARLGVVADMEVVRRAFTAAGLGEASLQRLIGGADGETRLLVRLQGAATSATEMERSEAVVRAALERVTGGATVLIEGVQSVGPAVGRRLQTQAAWAVLWAVVLIMIYIWIRFEYRFGVAAAVATGHDVLAVLGLMWLLEAEFNLLIVTALLTIAGYSLTDTVVVYDRIRENLRLHPADDLETNINRSVNEILSRTLVTTLTTSVPLLALYVYGSPVTRDFSLALLLGMVVGTYSSWYVAASFIVEWQHYRRRRAAEAAAKRFGPR